MGNVIFFRIWNYPESFFFHVEQKFEFLHYVFLLLRSVILQRGKKCKISSLIIKKFRGKITQNVLYIITHSVFHRIN